MWFYFLAFIILLGPLVFVHELGHFVFAKLFNVRVDVFSMGFGPKIFKKRWRETEYALSVIPLGGYVKLYGQDPTEAVEPSMRHRALNNLDAWKRFLVFCAGPLFNFLFAIVVFGVMLVIGEPHLSPVVARVAPASQAYVAGFRSGDVVTAIDRQVVTKFDDVNRIIADSPNKSLVFRVRRADWTTGKTESGAPGKAQPAAANAKPVKEIKVVPQPTKGLSIYGEAVAVGEIEGLWSMGRYTVTGISNPTALAARGGLKTGDEIVSFNGRPVKSWEALQALSQQALTKGAQEFSFGVVPHDLSYWTPESRPQPASQAALEIKLPARSLEQLGLYSSELFVASAVAGSPAEKAGLIAGDRLVSLDGTPLPSFQDLRELVQKAGEDETSFKLAIERDGKVITKDLVPATNSSRDAIGNETKQYMIGVYPLFVQAEPETFVERILNPITLTGESWSRALDLSAKTFISIKKLIFRQVSVQTLGGPILIGKLAGDSMSRGVSPFLKVMALISISLAIFNILPIPILDGGHIFLLLVEIVRGKPITIRQTEFVQQIGLSLIVLLLVVVLFNDISRVGFPALRQMFQ